MQEEKNNKNIINVVILSVIFGALSGLVGNLVWNAYFEDIYAPITGEINYSNGYYRSPRLEISDAKTVVVQQNERVDQVVSSARSSMVGLYKKIKAKEGAFNPDYFYKYGQEIADGFVITSDGWIMTNFKLEDAREYVVVDFSGNVYAIDQILPDKMSSLNFLKINARELPVRKFAEKNEIHNGQIALTVGWSGRSVLTSISESDQKLPGIVRSSDSYYSFIKVNDDLSGELVLFSLGGDAVGFIDKNGRIEPADHFFSVFSSLLSQKKIQRPSLGVNYIDLAGMVPAIRSKEALSGGAVIYRDDKGTAITPGGAASVGGLKEGDIILSIDNITLGADFNLTDAIQSLHVGDEASVTYIRNGERIEKEIKLGELKI